MMVALLLTTTVPQLLLFLFVTLPECFISRYVLAISHVCEKIMLVQTTIKAHGTTS